MVKPGKFKKKKSFTPVLRTPGNVSAKTTSVAPSVDELLTKATECEDRFETEESLKLYNRVLKLLEGASELNPTSATSSASSNPISQQYVKALQSSAFNLLELGKPVKAKERLLKVFHYTNTVDYEVYMYLGQLTEATESIDFYRRGIDALRHMYSNDQTLTAALTNKSIESLQRAESNALCAIAELYMTDLCDIPDARTECEKAIEAATQTDPTNPQAWLTSANFHTVTANAEAARDAVQRCLDLWWSKLEALLSDESEPNENPENGDKQEEGEQGMEEDDGKKLDLEEITGIPISGLIALSRMMIELEMYEKCATILEAILEEEEDNLEVYYLLTVIGRKLWTDNEPDLLRLYATTAKMIAGKLGDSEMVDEMTALLSELPPCSESQSVASVEVQSSDDDEDNPD